MFESRCEVCNPEEETKPEKVRELGKKEGVYVGESARSIFERASEHRGDMLARKDDSHVIKHWLSSHQELNSPPKFRIKVIGKYQDAMTRQIAEAVRIDLRGENVLNSKSEYSRCRIPRLVIDQEEWRINKKKERQELEVIREEIVMQEDEDGEECTNVLDEERVFESVEIKNKVDAKRRKVGSDKPPAKRKKLENLTDWGKDVEVGEDEPETEASSWLLSKETVAVNLDVEMPRMKQLELDLVDRVAKRFPQSQPDAELIQKEPPAKRKKTLKRLAKENQKLTGWLNANPKPSLVVPTTATQAEVVEMEISVEAAQPDPETIERRMRRDAKKEAWMVKEMINKLLGDVVRNIPGTSVVRGVIKEVVEMAWWRIGLNTVWSVLVNDRRMQRMVSWRMESQKMEEKFLMESMLREERLAVGRKRKEEILNTIMEVDDPEEIDMEWIDAEKMEHGFLSDMLEKLALECGKDVPMDESEQDDKYFDEQLEHTILDQLLLDWDIDTANTVGRACTLALSDDECIRSVRCTSYCTEAGCSLTSVSTEGEGRNECIRSAQCAGDCTVELCCVPAVVWGCGENAEKVSDGLEPSNQESGLPEIKRCLEPHPGRVEGTNMHETLEKDCDGNTGERIIIHAQPKAAVEGYILPDFDVWMKEMMSNVRTDRIQEDGHLHQVQVGDAEHDGDSLQDEIGAELGHNHSGDIVGMDIGLALPEEGVTGTELRHNHEIDSMVVDLGVAFPEGGGIGAELGHNHGVGIVNVNLELPVPGAGTEGVRQGVVGQDDGAVRREVRRLEGGVGGCSTNTQTSFGTAKTPRFVKPRRRRGVKKDSLIQTRIESLISFSGDKEISGLVRVEGNGKRKLTADVNNSNGAKRSKTLC